jgi:hypothetical protein
MKSLEKKSVEDASKCMQSKILQAQIDILECHIEHPNKPGYKRHDILDTIKDLKTQLKKI